MPKAFSSILKRDTGSRSVEKAQVRISYKLTKDLNTIRLHSGVFTAARTSSLEG